MRTTHANMVFGGLQHKKFVSPKRVVSLRKGSHTVQHNSDMNMTYTSKNFAQSLIDEARNRDTVQGDKIGQIPTVNS